MVVPWERRGRGGKIGRREWRLVRKRHQKQWEDSHTGGAALDVLVVVGQEVANGQAGQLKTGEGTIG